MKNKSLLIGLVLFLVIGGGAFAIWHFFLRPGKVDFDKVGGTILVYEIVPFHDRDKGPDLATNLATVLQKRLDPDDRGLASVQAIGKERVEIRIARASDSHKDDVLRVKEVLTTVGSLEFRILANGLDDKEAIDDARNMLNTPRIENEAALQKELKDLQEKGLPPPGPRIIGAKEPKVFEIRLPGEQKSLVTYSWLEVSPQELVYLNLDNAAEKDASRNKVWLEAKEFRGKAARLTELHGRQLFYGALFYSRKCEDHNLDEVDRKIKGVEYFVLARDPELDPGLPADLPLEKRRTPRVDGSFVPKAYAEKLRQPGPREVGDKDRWAVNFTLNAKGAELFRILTKKNVPGPDGPEESSAKRHLAIVLDGLILSSPTINSEIGGGRGMITGNFTEREIKNMASVLGGGALPARLKPQPVSETTVPPKK